MSDNGRAFRGRPNTIKTNENQTVLYQYCGGSGGGAGPPQLGVTGIVLEYKVSKYIVYNRKIILNNDSIWGIRITSDLLGSNDVPCYIGLSDRGDRNIQTTARASGLIATGALPYNIEFDERYCPQPITRPPAAPGPNTDWVAKVYVYLYWGNSAYYNQNADGSITTKAFRIIKHDNDMKI